MEDDYVNEEFTYLINAASKPEVPQDTLDKWQELLEIVSSIYDVPIAMILKVNRNNVEIAARNENALEYHRLDSTISLETGLFWDMMIARKKHLYVKNGLECFFNKVEIDENDYIYYYGCPLIWPDGSLYGSICVLEQKQIKLPQKYPEILQKFGSLINKDLNLLVNDQEKDFLIEQIGQANRLKNDCIINAAYGLRTPLGCIKSLCDISRENASNNFEHEFVNKISESAAQLQGVLEKLENVEKIESKSFSLHKTKVDLTSLYLGLIEKIDKQAYRKGIAFDVIYKNQIQGWVDLDLSHHDDILESILDNAIRYTPVNGKVTLTIVNSIKDGKVEFHYEVSDNGLGMSPEFLKEVFTPFAKEVEYKKAHIGAGVSLALAKHLANLFDGDIRVESEIKKGSTFFVDLKADYTPDYDIVIPPDNLIGSLDCLKDKFIMICEDNKINGQILEHYINSIGARAVLVNTGEEGFETFSRSQPDHYWAIIMDIHMPHLNGIDATKKIRNCSHPNAQDISIIGISASTNSEDIDAANAAGMDAYLFKPIDNMKLFEILCNKIQ